MIGGAANLGRARYSRLCWDSNLFYTHLASHWRNRFWTQISRDLPCWMMRPYEKGEIPNMLSSVASDAPTLSPTLMRWTSFYKYKQVTWRHRLKRRNVVKHQTASRVLKHVPITMETVRPERYKYLIQTSNAFLGNVWPQPLEKISPLWYPSCGEKKILFNNWPWRK